MPREAVGEVRALLDLMRKKKAAEQDQATPLRLAATFEEVLHGAASNFKILDSEVGHKKLIKEVAVEQAKLRRG